MKNPPSAFYTLASFFSLAGCFLMVISLGGCSYTYMDSNGSMHVIGLVDMSFEEEGGEDQVAGNSVGITTLGLSIFSTPLHTGFALGYNQENLTSLRQNVAIYPDPANTDAEVNEFLRAQVPKTKGGLPIE